MQPNTENRRYDIDWLRVVAIGLLLIYHIAIVFQPWGVLIGFPQSDEALVNLWVAMSMLNVWRIPLLFFVSGMGVYFAIRRRSLKELLLERSRRILVPFVFGILVIVPIHILIWQYFYHQDLSYRIQTGHLWFLANIFIYVLIFAPLFIHLVKHPELSVTKKLEHLFGSRTGLLLPALAFMGVTLATRPEIYELYAMTWHGFFLGAVAFFFGFMMMMGGNRIWQHLDKLRIWTLCFAFSLYMIRWILFDFDAPDVMTAAESIGWIFAVLGFSCRYLNRPSHLLGYLSEGAYPVYVLHMIFLYLGAVLVLPVQMNTVLKFVLISAFTFTGSIGTYEIIRRIAFLRPVFGLKSSQR